MTLDIRSHLLSRNVDFSIDRVYVNEELNTATFMLFNLSSQIVGYQHYNPKGLKGRRSTTKNVDVRDLKYHSRITKIDNIPMLAVYGLESFDFNLPYLFLLQGIFDYVKLHRLGLNAIAVIANNPIHLYSWLEILPQKKIAITDNDENNAGDMLSKYGDDSYMVPLLGNDLGDMSLLQVKEFISLIDY
jgi:hypothetical protein